MKLEELESILLNSKLQDFEIAKRYIDNDFWDVVVKIKTKTASLHAYANVAGCATYKTESDTLEVFNDETDWCAIKLREVKSLWDSADFCNLHQKSENLSQKIYSKKEIVVGKCGKNLMFASPRNEVEFIEYACELPTALRKFANVLKGRVKKND